MRHSKLLTHSKNMQSGQILIEMLVALTIITLSLAASYLVTVVSNEMLLDKKLSDQASLYVHEGTGAIESMRSRDWYALEAGMHGLTFDGMYWAVTSTQDVIGNFTRQVVITDTASHTKKIEVTVSWTGFPHISRHITSVTNLSQWAQEDLLFNIWLNPASLGSVDLDPGGNEGTGLAINGNYVYMSAYHTSVAKDDFVVMDVSNPASPSIYAQINTGAGLNAVAVKNGDTHAYAVSRTDSAGFKVIDISNPASPTTTATLNLSGTGANNRILVKENYAFVGTLNDGASTELKVIDITTPSSPNEVATLEIGGDVNDMHILQNTLYLATSNDNKEMIVVDITTSTAPTEIGSYDWTDTVDGLSVFAQSPSRIFLGRPAWGSGAELQILDVSAPSAIIAKGSKEIGYDVTDLVVVDWLAFLAITDSANELTIINVANSYNPIDHSTFNYSSKPNVIDFEGRYVYTASVSNDSLRIIQSQ
jgi:hypothetical protein